MKNEKVSYINQGLKKGIRRAIKAQILVMHRKDPDKPAIKILGDLKDWVKDKYGNVKTPGLRSVQGTIHDYENPETDAGKENKEKLEVLDRSWHLGLLRDYPHLSAEAVRHILEAQEAMRSYFENVPVNPDDYHLTVRQAHWVARLYDVVAKHLETDDFYREHWPDIKPDDPGVLFSVAIKYADYELLCDLAETPCDTSKFDAALSKGIWQFFEFYSEQNRQSSRERPILDPEGHRQPHKIDFDAGYLVFDPECEVCKSQEASGSLYDLRIGLAKKGVFNRQRAKRKEGKRLMPGEPAHLNYSMGNEKQEGKAK